MRGWDVTMHLLSGIFVGLGIALWLRVLLRSPKKFRLPFTMQALFIVGCSAIAAVVWEIIEFGSDQIFGTASQDRSLYDTMTDLIYGVIGVLLFTFLYSLVVKGRSVVGLKWAIETFERLNRK
jgi:hypothetical protein